MSDKVIMAINNIHKSFGPKIILNNVSFRFYDNNLYGIVGESGNGKTTLLNILGLIDENYQGKISLNGTDIINKKDYCEVRAKNIGFIFQSYYLIDSLSVKENILLPLKYAKSSLDEPYFENLVKTLSIDKLLNEKVNYLSGGEKQRVSIARALINKPKLIICDEPTGNLDPKNTDKVIDILKSFVEEGRVIILVTHSMDVASKCTKILHLEGGTLHE